MGTDERTGVQALERTHPGWPLAPEKVERREWGSLRHGTRAFMVSRDVVTGKMVAPHAGPTRTEADVLAPVQAVVATDPQATRWHFVCDTLTIHQSETLARFVAEHRGIETDVGIKGERGMLASMPSRAAFVSDSPHQIVFHSTPKQSSWLTQIDSWLSLLVRTLLTRGSFLSVDDVQTRVLVFLDSSNCTMAKPFTWTSQGKALTAETAGLFEPQCTSRSSWLCRSRCSRSIDPLEDTERYAFDFLAQCFDHVAGVSIRLRILKVLVLLTHLTSGMVAGVSIRLRILKGLNVIAPANETCV